MKRYLSLGAGVQSSTVLLMSCLGELPKLDGAIFADTGWEPKGVYEHLYWLERVAARAGIPVYRVSAGNIKKDAFRSRVRASEYKEIEDGRWAAMPMFTRTVDEKGRISLGQIKRQCTKEYKIEPIEKFLRQKILGLKKGERAPAGSIEQWFGISADEMHRMRIASVRWKTHAYPLVGWPEKMLPRPYTRQRCIQWLQQHYPDRDVPRSACIGCPFHSDYEWRQMRDKDPTSWADAVDADKKIRSGGGMRGDTFLHRSCKPLDEVDLSTAEERGQGNLWNQECQGMCGV